MPAELNERDLRRLLLWQRRMTGAFVGTWAYLVLVIAVQVALKPAPELIRLALGGRVLFVP